MGHFMRSLTKVYFPTTATLSCKFYMFLIASSQGCSSWFLVGVTIERSLVVSFPLKMRHFATSRKAVIYIVTVVLLELCFHCYMFMVYDLKVDDRGFNQCSVVWSDNTGFVFATMVKPWIELVFNSLTPWLLLLIFNTLLIVSLIRTRAEWKRQWGENSKENTPRELAATLAFVSFVYIVLVVPVRLCFVVFHHFPGGKVVATEADAVERLVWAVAFFCFYMNHTINFIIYCVTGRQYRQEVYGLLRCIPNTICSGSRSNENRTGSEQSVKTVESSLNTISVP